MSNKAIFAPVDGSPITQGAFVPGQRAYQVCVRCVMDTTDPQITFDGAGICSHCRYFDEQVRPAWPSPEQGRIELQKMQEKIRSFGKGRRYDCIIGLSGGIDSSFITVKSVEWGLRPLIVHVDAGWNSELAVMNIEQICRRLNLDLVTHVIDWEEMQDVQLAFLRSNLANQDTPQDHVFAAALYSHAESEGIIHVISGGNYATESILPKAWGYDSRDATLLKAVHARFGRRKLGNFPLVRFTDVYPLTDQRREILRPLNYISYNKEEAIRVLERDYGWRYYGGKHYESRWTRFFQAFYLPHKFGYDKRKAHLSSLIVSGQLSREEALHRLSDPLYEPRQLAEDKAFVAKKLGISGDELEQLIGAPPRHYSEFPNFQYKIRLYHRFNTWKRVALLPLRIVRRAWRVLTGERGGRAS